MATNRQKLEQLVREVFLIEASQYRLDLQRTEVDTWDSLGIAALGLGIQETFGVHLTPEEERALGSVADIFAQLEAKGVVFDD